VIDHRLLLDPDAIAAEKRRRARKGIEKYYEETGPLRRELYPKHMQFFAAGGTHEPLPSCPADCDGSPHRERCMMAANRVGKSEGCGAYELTLHLTGLYPPWWVGKRFDRPVRTWAAGDTGKALRDTIQKKLFGEFHDFGTGMIPGDLIVHRTIRSGVGDSVDTVHVKHVTGGRSTVTLKSYEMRRESFQGSEQDVIWLDEEPDEDIYVECLVRTMTTGGIIMLTFTPLSGLSEVVLSYLPHLRPPDSKDLPA
jgi:phage terminase large subunit-like protein